MTSKNVIYIYIYLIILFLYLFRYLSKYLSKYKVEQKWMYIYIYIYIVKNVIKLLLRYKIVAFFNRIFILFVDKTKTLEIDEFRTINAISRLNPRSSNLLLA